MPRRSRIDALGALHHIILRGIERRTIFKDDADREKFLDYLAILSGRFSIKNPYLFFNEQPLPFTDRNT